ncbi:IscS subfamily cysteine desulfurase [Candidatus Woesearchaeota archaeon]|nr:IscS subfamily cysteine desulfurase [Candidatus Woesearchaeota archaeon]
MRAYLDNAATTRVAPEVIERMGIFFSTAYANASSLHAQGMEAKRALDEARAAIAAMINASPEEIIFTGGGSESNNLALKGVAFLQKEKRHIITSAIEHPSILGTCAFLEKQGFSVTYLPVGREGFVSAGDVESAITDQTALVSIMHANNEIGTIQDLDRIGKACAAKGVPFHTDAVQSFTKAPIDVTRMGLSLVSLASHKIHGPKGVGALYVRKGMRLQKQIHGGHQENDRRAGTENLPGIAGFAHAASLQTPEHITKMAELRDYTITEIERRIPDVIVNGSRARRLCNNVNVIFKYIEGEALLFTLSQKGIAISTGSACSSRSLRPSHVLRAIGLPHEVAHGSCRVSISRYTTKQEIDYFLDTVTAVVAQLREVSPFTKMGKYEAYTDDDHTHEGHPAA